MHGPRIDPALLLPVFCGVVLRVANIANQVLGGDELHALRTALESSVGRILVTHHPADPCIPLTALYRLWMDAGFGLSELVMRGPVLLAGCVTIVVVPMLARELVGRRAALVLAWLLALSPLLVSHSRIARPYALTVLLGSCAVFSFALWWRGGRRAHAVVYVIGAALSIHLHLLSTAFVTTALLFALGDVLAGERSPEQPSVRALAGVAIALGLIVACLIGPAVPSLLDVAAGKQGRGHLTVASAWDAIRLLSGTRHASMSLMLLATSIAGGVALSRRDPWLASYLATLVAAQVGCVVLLAPLLIEHPLVLARYLVIALPALLLMIASGVDFVLGRVKPPWPRRMLGAALIALLVLTGPWLGRWWWASSFTTHKDLVEYTLPPPAPRSGTLPPPYLADLEPGGLVELPWPVAWRLGRTFPAYQRLHERRIWVSPAEPFFEDPRVAFRNVARDPRTMLQSGARYVVVHLDLAKEERTLTDPVADGQRMEDSWTRGYESRPELAFAMRLDADRRARQLEKRWGPPHYRDENVAVWDLEAVRKGKI